jgi:hypothetical protein
MKRKALALTLIMALLFSAVAGSQLVNLGQANPIPELYTKLNIENPQNTTYNVNTLTLNFSVESLSFFQWRHFSYSLDGKELMSVANLTVDSEEFIPINPGIYRELLRGNSVLPNLSEGLHNVTVYLIRDASTADAYYGEAVPLANARFEIDTTPPNVPILSLENKTYYSHDVEIDFTVNESVSQVTYSLDGKENVTLSENTLLSGLPNGDHNVTFFATDEAGNTVSQTVYFTIAEPFPTTIAVAAVVLVTVAGLGMFLFLRKRKQQRDSHDF